MKEQRAESREQRVADPRTVPYCTVLYFVQGPRVTCIDEKASRRRPQCPHWASSGGLVAIVVCGPGLMGVSMAPVERREQVERGKVCNACEGSAVARSRGFLLIVDMASIWVLGVEISTTVNRRRCRGVEQESKSQKDPCSRVALSLLRALH